MIEHSMLIFINSSFFVLHNPFMLVDIVLKDILSPNIKGIQLSVKHFRRDKRLSIKWKRFICSLNKLNLISAVYFNLMTPFTFTTSKNYN